MAAHKLAIGVALLVLSAVVSVTIGDVATAWWIGVHTGLGCMALGSGR